MFLIFWGFKGETLQQQLVNPEAERTLKEGQAYLTRAIEQDDILLEVLLRMESATRKGNDIILADGTVLPMLRSQSATGHFLCLADFYDEEWPTSTTRRKTVPSDSSPSSANPRSNQRKKGND